MFLEFLGGGSIQDVLTSKGGKGLPLKDARFYFACMVAAFDALHATNWMHRDLSAKNVMVDNYGYGKLIDCGLAKKVRESAKSRRWTPTELATVKLQAAARGRMQRKLHTRIVLAWRRQARMSALTKRCWLTNARAWLPILPVPVRRLLLRQQALVLPKGQADHLKRRGQSL